LNLLERFTSYIEIQQLFTKNDHLLLAISGGLDSVVLCHLCKEAGYTFTLAHCNFGLRGDESYRDEDFVRSLSAKLNVPVVVKQFDTKSYAVSRKLSIQVAARELRYHWFQEGINWQWETGKDEQSSLTFNHQSLTYIVTAHHLDDNIETVLMNLFKGTGISGLHGILPKTDKLVRPLLFAKRNEILDYAQQHSLTWVEDSSNAETKYTRNFFRHELIPAIEKVFPAVKQNLANSIERFKEAEMLYNQSIALHLKKLLEYKGAEVMVPVLKLQKITPLHTIMYEIVKDYGFSSNQVPEVIKLLSTESGKYILSGSHRILRNRAWLIISPLREVEESLLVIEEGQEGQVFGKGLLQINTMPAQSVILVSNPNIALLNKKEIQYPLLLRKWKIGDYFYPLGMAKKKKLARFFIDQKLSQNDKENIWVIESNKRIVWVIGYRIDNRFKLQPATQEVVRIMWKQKD
jgi:tRNA(Ile)-lysidine synthase